MDFKKIISVITIILPWPLRRLLLVGLLGYKIHPTSRIGLAWIFTDTLSMEAHSRIGHFTVCKGLSSLILKEYSSIGRGNWISGFPQGNKSFYAHQVDRVPSLELNEHSAITNRHLIDCTNSVTIGKFTTFAGFRSQILTHSIDLNKCRQSSAPIVIGDYCFVGTDCVFLGGSALPNKSVLAAKSLLNKKYVDELFLYGGVPAIPIKALSGDYRYFSRITGSVH